MDGTRCGTVNARRCRASRGPPASVACRFPVGFAPRAAPQAKRWNPHTGTGGALGVCYIMKPTNGCGSGYDVTSLDSADEHLGGKSS